MASAALPGSNKKVKTASGVKRIGSDKKKKSEVK
jgi:hypothetical protein